MVVVRYLVLIISLALWSVVGFLIWVPLLIRITIIFVVAILHGAITTLPHRVDQSLISI